jgi:hypothetical protein
MLFHRKSFKFQTRISASISFCDLLSLYVVGSTVSFSSKHVHIRIKHDVPCLFHPSDADSNGHPAIQRESLGRPNDGGCCASGPPYSSVSLFLDCLLSCAFRFKDLQLTPAMLSQVALLRCKTFDLTQEMLLSPLFPVLLLCLSYEQEVSRLRFKDFHLAAVLNDFRELVRYNRFVQTVTFEHGDFEDSAAAMKQIFEKAHGVKPSEWVFINCDLSKPHFASSSMQSLSSTAQSHLGLSALHIRR